MTEDTPQATGQEDIEEIVNRTLDQWARRHKQEEEAQIYEQQELRKWAFEQAVKICAIGTATITLTQKADEFAAYITK